VKKATLVFPRFRYPSGDFSLGLASVGASLRLAFPDLELDLIDTTHHPSLDYVRSRLRTFSPQICLIYSDTLMFNDAVAVAGISKGLGMHVLVGGPHPTVSPEASLASDAIDAVCIGEGEVTAVEYLDQFFGPREFERVEGVWFKREGTVVRNQMRPPVADLDALPFPAVDLFDVERYLADFVQLDSYRSGLRGLSIVASRGCPFQCTYCQPTLRRLFGPTVRFRSPENVVAELKGLKGRYGIKAFYLHDDTLTLFKDWVERFCRLLRTEGLGLIWACNSRADTADARILVLMRDAGLVKVKVGIESVSDRMRNGIYRKNISMEQIEAFLLSCRTLGIQVAGFFMLGGPTETEVEVRETIRFAVRSSLVEANFSIATPLPGTGLFDYVQSAGWALPQDCGDFDYYQVRRPRMSKEDVSVGKLKFYKKLANALFYLHPKRLSATRRQLMQPGKLAMKLKRI
jgi:radical SAM superfamily enzyme YgiQ (UPF0313 family)